MTSLDTCGLYIGIHVPFLPKLFISVSCYNHLIHNCYSCEKKSLNFKACHTSCYLTLSNIFYCILNSIYICVLHPSGSHHIKQTAKLVD